VSDHLFGEPITIEREPEEPRGRRRYTANGYAARPGGGPEGETCKSCAHCIAKYWDGRAFYKCELMRPLWTNSYGSDIRLKSPACRHWEGSADR